jgi:hypothetical protein
MLRRLWSEPLVSRGTGIGAEDESASDDHIGIGLDHRADGVRILRAVHFDARMQLSLLAERARGVDIKDAPALAEGTEI